MKLLSDLPPRLAAAAKRETRGELVRWIGRPSSAVAFRASLPIWLMGVPWSALMFTIFGVLLAAVFSGKSPTRQIPQWEYFAMGAAILFTGGFVLIGLGMLATPPFAAWKARRTAYVITDKRLLTITTGRRTTIRSVEPHRLLSLQRNEHANGSGTLTIVTGHAKGSDGDRMDLSEQLIGVPDVAKAERLLRALAADAMNSSNHRGS